MSSHSSDDEEIPDYSNWKKPEAIIIGLATKETIEETEYDIPDYTKWGKKEEKRTTLKKNEPLLDQVDLPREKIEIFKDILKQQPKDVKFTKPDQFSFLTSEVEDDSDDNELSYDEWKKKKFHSEKKEAKKPVDFMKMIQELEQRQETLKPQMNKEEHQKFVSCVDLIHFIVGMDVSSEIHQVILTFCNKVYINSSWIA
jgi:hypothetical protein